MCTEIKIFALNMRIPLVQDHKIGIIDPTLAEICCLFLKNSLAETTCKNYSRAIKKYNVFCKKYDVDPYPLDEISVMLFLTSRVHAKPAYGTLTNELCGIQKFQHLMYGNWDTKSGFLLRACLKGIRRYLGDKKKKPKMPLTMDKLALTPNTLPLIPSILFDKSPSFNIIIVVKKFSPELKYKFLFLET